MSNNPRYIAQAISHQIYDAEGDKAPRVGVELRVVEGPETGKTLFYYGNLHENAQQFTIEALRNMGWTCNDITALTGLGSTRVVAIEKPNTFTDKTGKTRTNTQLQIWPIKTPKPTLEADAKASFAARFKALAASVPKIEVTEMNAGLTADAMPAALPKNGTSTAPTTAGVGSTSGGPLTF